MNCFHLSFGKAVWLLWFTAFSLFAAVEKAPAVQITRNSLVTNSFENLDAVLEPLRRKFHFPALAVAVCSSDTLVAAGAVGVRKEGTDAAVQLTDKFHLGSCTKSMTALLAGLLVEKGVIQWDVKVREIFPDWKTADKAGEITLQQLLNNRSGLAYSVKPALWIKAFSELRGTPREQRIAFLEEALQEELKSQPGKKYIYSNTGYALAGAMLEQATDSSWENMVREFIFKPLHMTTAGFGPPNFPGMIDQPYGHAFEGGKAVPQPRGDNPIAIAPAAAAHCSILDLAQYAAFHLAAARGEIPALSNNTLQKLYSAAPEDAKGDYGMGWIVLERNWAGGKALTHAGSNTMFHALIWIAPARNLAFVLATNIGDRGSSTKVARSADKVIEALIQKYISEAR